MARTKQTARRHPPPSAIDAASSSDDDEMFVPTREKPRPHDPPRPAVSIHRPVDYKHEILPRITLRAAGGWVNEFPLGKDSLVCEVKDFLKTARVIQPSQIELRRGGIILADPGAPLSDYKVRAGDVLDVIVLQHAV
jgi:hypothetical protein